MSIRKKGSVDIKTIKDAVDRISYENRKTVALGEKFLSDKDVLEKEIDNIEDSSLSYEDKKKILEELKKDLQRIQKEYEFQVIEENEKLQERQEEEIEKLNDAYEELIEQEENLRLMKFGAGSMSTLAADEVTRKKEEYKKLRDTLIAQKEFEREQLKKQFEEMKKIKFRGR